MAEEKEVYINPIIWWLKNITQCLPLAIKNRLSKLLVGQGMEYFRGRQLDQQLVQSQ